MTESTELTVPERAAVALGTAEHEKALIELSTKYADITKIVNPAGREQAHAAYMTLKNARIAIEKAGKDARDDATKFSKAVIQEVDRLTAITADEERRLQNLRDTFDAEREAERLEKLAVEKARVDAIRAVIDGMRNMPASMVGQSSAEIGAAADHLSETVISLEDYQEFAGEGQVERDHAVKKLREMQEAMRLHEFQQAALEAERETLARERAEAAERDRVAALERQRIADEERIARAKAQAAMLAEQEAHERRMAAEREAANAAWLAQHEAEQASLRAQQEAADKMAAAMSEIQGIQQQVIIAQSGRLGVRKGGTIECIRETLAETEAWEIDAERFGILASSAESAKTTAVAEIRRLLVDAERKEAEDVEARRQREEAERAAAIEAQRVAEAEAAEAARLQAEKDAAEREQIRRVRVQFEKNGPGDEAIVTRLADIFDVKPLVVVGWLEKFNAAAFKAPEEKAA
ncbi:coiled-coil domain-containing protein [Paraburkholderia elongata]|uniref:Uncharacterized protein n=1 Tax=Paraburkholderia elongata TaxID=2675747 RepID=A0A972NWE7_9BURK|nr:hypothetical protein [Paraburkholderia elongata]NPT59042.1 hypothetical protein [Paraburkholderia elongata]